jgi:hypothetical protein
MTCEPQLEPMTRRRPSEPPKFAVTVGGRTVGAIRYYRASLEHGLEGARGRWCTATTGRRRDETCHATREEATAAVMARAGFKRGDGGWE